MNFKLTPTLLITAAVATLFAMSLAVAASGLTSAAGDPTYYSVDPIQQSGTTWTESTALNNDGQVAGSFEAPNGWDHAFRWSNGSMTDLGAYQTPENYSEGYGISNSGLVVGCSDDPNAFARHAFSWTDSTTSDMLWQGGCANDANPAGQVVGWIAQANPFGECGVPVILDDGDVLPLPMGAGHLCGWINAINENGQSVGNSHDWASPQYQAAMWEDGARTPLPSLGAGPNDALDINDAGFSVGHSYTPAGDKHAVIWFGTAILDIHPPGANHSSAVAINNQDLVLIQAGSDVYLWNDGEYHDLNQLVDPASGWDVDEVIDINDNGWILVEGDGPGDADEAILKPCAACAPTPTPTPTATPLPVDFEVTGMEITQGIQNLDNKMPLVEGRETFVRVYVKELVFNDGTKWASGRLRAFDGGVELPDSPITAADGGIVVEPNGGSRLHPDQSLLFHLPPLWRDGTMTFTVEVNYDGFEPENEFTNNEASQTVTFQSSNEINIVMVPLELYANADPNEFDMTYDFYERLPDSVQILGAVRRYHPISTINLVGQTPLIAPDSNDPASQWDLNKDADASAMLAQIKKYNLLTEDPVPDLFYMGMVHPTLNAGGLGYRPGFEAWSTMINQNLGSPDWFLEGGKTIAHELGHNKGLQHVPCDGTEFDPDPDYPWPFPGCALADVDPLGYFGLDVYHQALNLTGGQHPMVISNDPNAAVAHRAFPMMGYNWPRWISPYEYCKLLPTYGIPCGLTWPASDLDTAERQAIPQERATFNAPQAVEALVSADDYLVAIGIIDTVAISATLEEVFLLDELAPDALQQAATQLGSGQPLGQSGDPVQLVQLDAGDQVLDSQPIFLGVDETPSLQSFLEVVSLLTDTVKVQVVNGIDVLAEREASANPPQVTLISPNGGETWDDGITISWTASDLDGDDLTFDLLYGSDGGAPWVAIALGLTGNSYTLTSRDGIGGSGDARIRVMANDGFYSAYDDSDGVFSVPNAEPRAVLLSPLDGATGLPTDLILTGLGTDVEDGALDWDDLSWSSDVDGFLGIGAELWTKDLSPGWHTLILTVVDSEGEQANASIRVLIGHESNLPFVMQAVGGPLD